MPPKVTRAEPRIAEAIALASQHSAYNTLRYFIQKGYMLQTADLVELIDHDTSPNLSKSTEFIDFTDDLEPEQILRIVRFRRDNTENILNLFYNRGYTMNWRVYKQLMRELGFGKSLTDRVGNWFVTKILPDD